MFNKRHVHLREDVNRSNQAVMEWIMAQKDTKPQRGSRVMNT